jgi:hypothetical protein
VRLLIAITSCRRDCRKGFNQALRDTWLQDLSKHPEVTYKFFVGDGTPTDDNEIAIIASQKGGKDLNRGIDYEAKGKASAAEATAEPLGELKDDEILLPVPDDYRHIAVKVREVFRWALKHGFTNVFKCETDSYVVVDRLLKSDFTQHDIVGGAAGRNIAGGSGWGISKKAMEAVVDDPINTWSDDCWFPTLLRNKGFKVSHDPRYSDDRVTRTNDLISTHCGFKAGYDTSRMYRLHKSFNGNAPRALITISSWVTGATNGDNDAIRETYATQVADYPNLDYKFFIGDGTPISIEDEKRLEPAVAHATKGHRLKAISTKNQAPFTYSPKSDEVVVPCPDGYLYLGHKTWHSHKWAIDNGYEFIFQCFPDTFIHIPRLVESGFEDYDFTGWEIGNARKGYYPAGGNGYWTSRHAAELMLQEPVDDWAEDRWAGKALLNRGIRLHHDPRYSAELPRLDNNLITAHLCDTPKVYNSGMMRDAFVATRTTTPPEPTVYPKYAKPGSFTRRPLRNDLTIDWFASHPRGANDPPMRNC